MLKHFDNRDGTRTVILRYEEDIAAAAVLTGLSVEYLTTRYEDAKAIGRNWTASVDWTPAKGD